MNNESMNLQMPSHEATYHSPPLEERTETDNVTSLELQRNRRLLYFSDGTMEEPSDSDNEAEIDVPDKSLDLTINENELAFVPRLRYKASRMGSNILAGIDYVGGGLASFLGITTPKYASEMEYYKQSMAKSAEDADEEANDYWGASNGINNNSNNIVVTTDPKRN